MHDPDREAALGELIRFRQEFHGCLTARADALFELVDAVLCTEGPVRSLVGLSLAPEHRRGHGALYDAVNCGRIEFQRLRTALAGVPLPRAADERLVLAVDISPWLRPDTSSLRSFCHTYGRGKDEHRMIPGWPYKIVAALETGRTSWTALLDALRLQLGADVAAVTAVQIREVVERLVTAGQWRDGDPGITVVLDAGYDAPRIAHLLGDLPVKILGRMLIIACHTQLRLARPLATDLRRPWEKPVPPERLTPARVRRGFRNLRARTPSLACAPKPTRPGPGRPPGSTNRQSATRHDVGRILATGEAYSRPTHHKKGTKPRRTG